MDGTAKQSFAPCREAIIVSKLRDLIREEAEGLHGRLLLARLLLAPLPIHVGGRLRVAVLRRAGFQIGHGTIMWGLPTFTGRRDLYKNLRIGRYCWFNVGCFFDLGAPVHIGERASVGHEVVFLTTSHDLGACDRRAGTIYRLPITVGEGAWIGARCTILPGIDIGAGAVIAAGAVVTHNVPPHTLMGGVPAKPIRALPENGSRWHANGYDAGQAPQSALAATGGDACHR